MRDILRYFCVLRLCQSSRLMAVSIKTEKDMALLCFMIQFNHFTAMLLNVSSSVVTINHPDNHRQTAHQIKNMRKDL